MWTRFPASALLVLTLVLPAAAQTTALPPVPPPTALQLFRSVQRQVLTYSHFSVFDSINAQIKDGTVTLTGKVTMPFKRTDLEQRVSGIKGIKGVINQIEVLPASKTDDELRVGIANAIYGNPDHPIWSGGFWGSAAEVPALALAPSVPASPNIVLQTTGQNSIVVSDDRVRVLDFQLKKGAKEDFHAHPAAVTYVLTPFKIRFTFPDGSTRVREAKAGDVFYGDALTHASENIGDTDAHGLLIEMKSAAKSMLSEADLLTAVTFIRGPEGSEQDLLTELLSTTAPTRAEPGNLRYDLYQSPTNKNYFMRFEVWRNPQALEEHKATPHLKASFERRKNEGWMTEITTWKRVSDGTP